MSVRLLYVLRFEFLLQFAAQQMSLKGYKNKSCYVKLITDSSWNRSSSAGLQDNILALELMGLGTCVLLLLFNFDTMHSWVFFPLLFGNLCPKVSGFSSAKQPLNCAVVWLGGWTLHKPESLSDRCGFQDQDHLESNEKKSAIASNQGIQLCLKKHCGILVSSSEPVCKPLERMRSKCVRLDQAGFVVKREFIRKYSENNKHD